MARLDRLGTAAKEIAQIGAVLGREFGYELIQPVAQRHERELQAALDQLGDAGLLFCRGTAPHASYLFKHALVQDAAYSTLLRGRRQELHARVAAALEQHFADLVERQPELLAHHLTAAGDTERAVDQWLKAGQHAAARLAYLESIAHFERGLGLLRSLPESPTRNGSEIELPLALGLCLLTAKGAVAAKPAYTRALELAESSGEPRQRFEALYGVWQSTMVSGGIAAASPLSERLLRMAEREGDDGCGSRRIIASGRRGIWPGIRQKLASTPTPGAFSTIRRSTRPIVWSMADMIPVSAPETVALRPNGCLDIPRRRSPASPMLWRWPSGSPTRSPGVSLSLIPRWFTSIAASPSEHCAKSKPPRRWLRSNGSRWSTNLACCAAWLWSGKVQSKKQSPAFARA
jgi:hypothetical protein